MRTGITNSWCIQAKGIGVAIFPVTSNPVKVAGVIDEILELREDIVQIDQTSPSKETGSGPIFFSRTTTVPASLSCQTDE